MRLTVHRVRGALFELVFGATLARFSELHRRLCDNERLVGKLLHEATVGGGQPIPKQTLIERVERLERRVGELGGEVFSGGDARSGGAPLIARVEGLEQLVGELGGEYDAR